MWIPDPKWEAPSLLIPGREPVGPVVVDRSHPAGAGLSRGYVGGQPLRGDPLTVVGNVKFGPYDRGLAHTTDNAGTSAYLKTSSLESYLTVPVIDVTVFSIQTSTTTEGYIFSSISNGTALIDELQITWNSSRRYIRNGALLVARLPATVNDGKQHCLIWVYYGGNTYKVFLDGFDRSADIVYDNQSSVDPLPATLDHPYWFLVRNNRGTPNSTGAFNRLHAYYRINRYLSNGALKSLSKEPYQFLIPACMRPSRFFKPSAAPPSVIKTTGASVRQLLGNQYAAVAASKLNGVLQ